MQRFITSWDEVPVVMDIPLACRILGKSPEWIKRKARDGEFPATKCGDEWRIEKDQLRLYLTQNRALNMAPDAAV